jgi:hypothetical protein
MGNDAPRLAFQISHYVFIGDIENATSRQYTVPGQEYGRTIPLPDAARSTLKRQPPTTVSIRSELLSYSVLSIRPII